MTDVESSNRPGSSSAAASRPTVPNPYAGNMLPAYHPFNLLRRIIYMSVSFYGLLHFKVYRTILRSPNINHEWFKIGLATTIAILTIKAYVELYEGRLKKEKVNYDNFRQTTHAVMFLMLLSTVAFNAALWPHYGWNSPLVLGIAFFGLILQLMLLVPTYIQNIVGLVALTFFLQEYS